MRNADGGTVFLHPHIGPYLAADLLVYRTGVSSLGKLMRHREAKDKLLRQTVGLDVDRDTDVEAASNPFARFKNGATVFAAESEVMFRQCSDCPSLLPQAIIQFSDGGNVLELIDDVEFLFGCQFVGNWTPSDELQGSGHYFAGSECCREEACM